MPVELPKFPERLPFPVIDAHCHLAKGDGLAGPLSSGANLNRYLAQANDAGIDRAVLFAIPNSDYARSNKQVAMLVRKYPDRFYGFVLIHPVRDRGRVDNIIKHYILNNGFCGVKVHRHDGPITREICDAARTFSLPILYDNMSELEAVKMLGENRPDIAFIIPHLGSFSDNWGIQRAMIDLLEKYPNIFTDTSAVRRCDLLEMAVKKAGSDKILFGTDAPFMHPAVELCKIYQMHLPKNCLSKILSGNFLRLLNRVNDSRLSIIS